jgi:hypothetical protein
MQATLELVGRENCDAFFSAVLHREAFPGLRVQDIAEFDSDRCSVFCLLGEEKKRERNSHRAFFPGLEARHTLLPVLHGIFVAVRCN